MIWDLQNGYTIRKMEEAEFEPLYQKYAAELFDETMPIFRLRDLFDDGEKEKLRELKTKLGSPFSVRLGVFKGTEWVGWHYGYQESALRFYMCNSAILPAHRRQGLYSELIKRTVEIVTEQGFQEIYSRHMPTNNEVIIPKLKSGFLITGLQIDDVMGTLLHLTYFTHPYRTKVLQYRVGHIKPDEEMKARLKI